jgi:hypothetical protein
MSMNVDAASSGRGKGANRSALHPWRPERPPWANCWPRSPALPAASPATVSIFTRADLPLAALQGPSAGLVELELGYTARPYSDAERCAGVVRNR